MDKYNYQSIRPELFTKQGQSELERVREQVSKHLAGNDHFIVGEILRLRTVDTFVFFACLDRLVELGELEKASEATQDWREMTFRRSQWQMDPSPDAVLDWHQGAAFKIQRERNFSPEAMSSA